MGRVILNTEVKTSSPKHRIFSEEPYAQEMYDLLEEYFAGRTFEPKDLVTGGIYHVVIDSIDEQGNAIAHTNTFATVYIDAEKENRFLERIGHDLLSPNMGIDVTVEKALDGSHTGSIEYAYKLGIKKDLMQALQDGKAAYTAKFKAINDGGYIVEVSGLDCFMPNSLAAANRITDLQSMIGKTTTVMVETYLDQSNMFVVSRKKYIQAILPSRVKELDMTKEYEGTATGSLDYGLFVEWDEIFTALLHESEAANEDWRSIKPGEAVRFYIKEIKDNNRIILSQKGPNPEIAALAKFKEECEGYIYDGAYIKDIKPFGAFIEMGDVTGMLPTKELKKFRNRPKVGDDISVFVKTVDTQTKKIHLRATTDED